jgi:hypothetical protein
MAVIEILDELPVDTYRHRLIFLSEQQAKQAENEVDGIVGNVIVEDWVGEDTDQIESWEYVFITEGKVSDFDQGIIVGKFDPASYSFNAEEV